MENGVPFLTFDSADFPAGEGRRRWESLVGAYDVTLPEGRAEAEFYVASESWLLGQMLLIHGRLTPVNLSRSVTRIATDGRDTFTFGLVTRGLLAGDFDNRACELRPGQVCAIDFARPWQVQTAKTEFILLVVPRQALLDSTANAHDLHGRLLEGAAARILTEHLIALMRHLPQAAASDAPIMERMTLGMIADSLQTLSPGEDAGPGPLESRLTYRVRRYIEEHLGAPDLSPATICKALGVTRPTLYRTFSHRGGIMRYIQRRRLEAVHVRLSDPAEDGRLETLALNHGFSSHAHFSTAFRRRFGYAPRDSRLGAESSADGPGAQFRSWLLELTANPGGV